MFKVKYSFRDWFFAEGKENKQIPRIGVICLRVALINDDYKKKKVAETTEFKKKRRWTNNFL